MFLSSANVTASSELEGRTAQDARLHGGSAWSAKESDFSQYLIFDLKEAGAANIIIFFLSGLYEVSYSPPPPFLPGMKSIKSVGKEYQVVS